MKGSATVVFNSWARFPADHPDVASMRLNMTAPNPLYQSAMRSGRPIDEDVPQRDMLWTTDEKGRICIPRAYAEKYLTKGEYKDARIVAPVKFPHFALTLDTKPYAGQLEFCAGILAGFLDHSGLIAEAETGFGKTVCVIKVIFDSKQRTLILVHTEFLMRQWQERLQAAGLKPSQIGCIQQNREEWGGKYLVSIAMIQTLLARQYSKLFYAAFGLVVADEVHNMGATTFRETVTMFNPMWRLGISATPKRKDGCEIVFRSHIGPVMVWGKKRKLKPTVHQIRVQHELSERQAAALQAWRRDYATGRWGMRDDLVKIETYLTNHASRNQRLLRILERAVLKGRKTLVLTSRIKHLEFLRAELTKRLRLRGKRTTIGVFRGGMKEEAWAVSSGCPLIVGTYQIAREALDVPALDVLVLSTPRSDIIQAVGRILREHPGKKAPVVVDFVDEGMTLCEILASKRLGQYQSKGWSVNGKE